MHRVVSGASQPRRPPERSPRRPSVEAVILSAVFLGVAAGLLLVTITGVHVLSGLRAYVNGEALYSKGQKDAVRALERYAAHRDPADWERFRSLVAVPEADGRARRLLSQVPPELAGAERALVEGGNHPDDVATMARLFRHADRIPELGEAVGLWEQGDALIDELVAIAHDLRRELEAAEADPAVVAAALAEVERIDGRITVLETSFSAALGRGARRVERSLVAAAALAALAFVAIATWASARLLARMRAREARFRFIIENTSDIVTIVDEAGLARYESPSVERVLGWKPEEIVGGSAFDYIHPEDQETTARVMRELMADPSATRSVAYRFRHRDGSWRTMAATGSSYLDETGERRIIANARDITAQRELEARLAQASRLESVGRLAGGVAHDFNNLLTIVLAAVEAAREALPSGSPAQEDLSEIVAATGRAANLTRQLLAFARRQVVEPEVLDLGGVICELESMLRRLLDETIELSIETAEAPTHVCADRSQLEQVLLNLVVNARDAMPAGGRLSVRVDTLRPDAATAARETEGQTGPFVRLEVVDTGQGMAPEVVDRIFEPFFSTKVSTLGTGLGLATSYGIVKQSGGHIAVESGPGRGTRFRVYLPLSPPAEAAPGSAPVAFPQHGAGHETLLLVEDQAEVRRVIAKALRARGFQVLEAADGEQALRIARKEAVDLLVSDVVIPRMGGAALAARLREEQPALPVVFISGYSPDDPVPENGTGRTALVGKPFTPEELVREIRRLLDRGL